MTIGLPRKLVARTRLRSIRQLCLSVGNQPTHHLDACSLTTAGVALATNYSLKEGRGIRATISGNRNAGRVPRTWHQSALQPRGYDDGKPSHSAIVLYDDQYVTLVT
ncbi:hypothetical protein BHE74_00024212 [Ensete ventricosum]|nr:hypothetical protein BHE74_00024212 [Ensete ventricosum]